MIDQMYVGILLCAVFCAACFETFRLISLDGKMRRGFCFRRVPLTEVDREFLASLQRDTSKIDKRYLRFENVVWANGHNFILREGSEFCGIRSIRSPNPLTATRARFRQSVLTIPR